MEQAFVSVILNIRMSTYLCLRAQISQQALFVTLNSFQCRFWETVPITWKTGLNNFGPSQELLQHLGSNSADEIHSVLSVYFFWLFIFLSPNKETNKYIHTHTHTYVEVYMYVYRYNKYLCIIVKYIYEYMYLCIHTHQTILDMLL